jgi:hypothetical protein
VTADALQTHAAQVVQGTGERRGLGDQPRQARTETVQAITSRTARQASPDRLADLIGATGRSRPCTPPRPTFAKDASQLRTGSGPSGMATLRNLVLGVLSRAGPVNLAAALGGHAQDPPRPLAPRHTLGTSSDR